jgi:phosphinothricin acetyltransferase
VHPAVADVLVHQRQAAQVVDHHGDPYAQTKETSIYLGAAAQGRGVGTTLYAALLDRLRDDGIYTVIAVIASPNPASAALHRALGFEQAGALRRVGYKFGRRLDTEFWQLMLG